MQEASTFNAVAGQELAEKSAEVQEMEDRVAQAESALNVANAHIEEQAAITSPVSLSSQHSGI